MKKYKVYDKYDLIYEIRKNMEEEHSEIYLLTGKMKEDTLIIKEYYKFSEDGTLDGIFSLNEMNQEKNKEENDLQNNIKNIKDTVVELQKAQKPMFLLRTHPTEYQRQLAGNEEDQRIFESIYNLCHDTYKYFPIFFGIMGKETISIKVYIEELEYSITYQSGTEIDNNPNYDIEFVYNENEEEGILRFIKSKKEVKLPIAKIYALKQWKEQREKKQLPQLHDIAYKNLLAGYYKC